MNMKTTIAGLLALALCGTASAATWEIKHTVDEMNDRWSGAHVATELSVTLPFPFNEPGNFGLITLPAKGDYFSIALFRGIIPCPKHDPCGIKIRFDDEEYPNVFQAENGGRSGKLNSIFLDRRSFFFKKAKEAKRIRVQLPIYKSAPIVLDFKLDQPLTGISNDTFNPQNAY